ncbi:hypothetical protein TrRE_jg2101 [Triparma retinervis]|uniref:NADH dehydrogenase [ubiquinone] 1 beta subcomplex subunit 9 n=1 Tax=Triparma retinervis TaxID=2557542 RepID=A0A9W7AVB4_9STRA|nr:hypothetical protein TrRE_jg2101 [Triparma retinervis]
MNQAFRLAGDQFRQQLPELTQSQQVVSIYRRGLRALQSWCVDRQIFCEEADKLRMEFESNRSASPALVTRLIKEAELKLVDYQHPDPYCIPGMPGGSLFMRNPPLPMSVCFPDGDLPPDAPKREINPDWSTAVTGGPKSGSGQVVVDFTRKNMT